MSRVKIFHENQGFSHAVKSLFAIGNWMASILKDKL